MNWKHKALAQTMLSRLPYATSLNYLAQRFVTRAHAHLERSVADRLGKGRWFLEAFTRHCGVAPADAHFYEFGAGWNLAGPLSLYGLGVGRQTVIDIAPCLQIPLVNKAVGFLQRSEGELNDYKQTVQTIEDLNRFYGIRYCAPLDGRRTGLESASVDCITSTFTMEHIPREDVRAILHECFRLLKPGAVICALIDYQDHYSYRDFTITAYNFLQYSERQWRPFNSSLHYQNRMRHREYADMFKEAGFQVMQEDLNSGSQADRDALRSLHLADEFRGFTLEDLVIRSSKMVAVKPIAVTVGSAHVESNTASLSKL